MHRSEHTKYDIVAPCVTRCTRRNSRYFWSDPWTPAQVRTNLIDESALNYNKSRIGALGVGQPPAYCNSLFVIRHATETCQWRID